MSEGCGDINGTSIAGNNNIQSLDSLDELRLAALTIEVPFTLLPSISLGREL